MAKKIIQSQSKPDFRRCKYGGEEKNYMCYCSALSAFRSVGVRPCSYYVSR